MFWHEGVVNMSKELLFVAIKTMLVVGIASSPAGPDAVSRAVFLGMIQAAAIFFLLSWGNNSPLPRHGNWGLTCAEVLAGRLSWYWAIFYPGVGFLGAVLGAGLIFATGTSAFPIVGGTNPTNTGGALTVELMIGIVIILTILDQFSARNGGARNQDANAANNINWTKESVGARPAVSAIVSGSLTAWAYLKFGIFTGSDTYTYFAGALAQQFIGDAQNPWNNGPVNNISGIWAMWIFVPLVSGIAAFLLDALFYWLHNNGYAEVSDDYGNTRRKKRVSAKVPRSNSASRSTSARQRAPAVNASGVELTSNGW